MERQKTTFLTMMYRTVVVSCGRRFPPFRLIKVAPCHSPSWLRTRYPTISVRTTTRPRHCKIFSTRFVIVFSDTIDAERTGVQITPLEFGSWDPALSAMANLTYAGTHLNNGNPDNSSACVTRFDQAGYIMGTSASLFNVSVQTAS